MSAWSPGTELADLYEDEGIPFVLGYALSIRAIHGGKAKNDRINGHQIVALLSLDPRQRKPRGARPVSSHAAGAARL